MAVGKPWQTIASGVQGRKFADILANSSSTRRIGYRIVSGTAVSNSMTAGIRVCGAASATNASSSRSSVSSRPSQSASTRLQWGSYVGNTPSDIAAFEAQVGKSMDIVAIFLSAQDEFPTDWAPAVRDQGKTLLIFWEPHGVALDDIIHGSLDAALTRYAADAKAYGGKVIFSPFHEMNGDWDDWGGVVGTNTPQKLIDAWRHVHDILSTAPNIEFGWAVNHESIPNTNANRFEVYYPGDAYVDIVGVDGFNWGDPWQTFDQIFADSLYRLRAYKKPIMIFSMGSAEGPQKAAWMTDTFAVQLPRNPDIVGWLWFNEDKERDWRIWSDPAALDAFKKSF